MLNSRNILQKKHEVYSLVTFGTPTLFANLSIFSSSMMLSESALTDRWRSVLPKHQAFLFFHKPCTVVHMNASNHFRSFSLMRTRSDSHHSCNVDVGLGITSESSNRWQQQCQTSLAYTHWIKMCSAVSSSCKQTKQGEV